MEKHSRRQVQIRPMKLMDIPKIVELQKISFPEMAL